MVKFKVENWYKYNGKNRFTWEENMLKLFGNDWYKCVKVTDNGWIKFRKIKKLLHFGKRSNYFQECKYHPIKEKIRRILSE